MEPRSRLGSPSLNTADVPTPCWSVCAVKNSCIVRCFDRLNMLAFSKKRRPTPVHRHKGPYSCTSGAAWCRIWRKFPPAANLQPTSAEILDSNKSFRSVSAKHDARKQDFLMHPSQKRHSKPWAKQIVGRICTPFQHKKSASG